MSVAKCFKVLVSISGHSQAHPIDFSRVNLQDLNVPEVMPLVDTFDDHELDQYLPPNGLAGMPGHMVGSSQSDQYSSCYQGNVPTTSSTAWSSCYRPSTGSCMQSYGNANTTLSTSNNTSNNNNIPSPYDLSGNHSPSNSVNSPNSPVTNQSNASPNGMHSPSYQSTSSNNTCKAREDDNSTSVKLEPLTHRGPAPKYPYDNKFDYNGVPSRYDISNHQNMYSGANAAHSQYNHAMNYSHMGMSRQMFNPIAAAVPSDQQWERYT